MEYHKDTILVAGSAKSGTDNPITAMYNYIILILILEKSTGNIVDAEMNSVCGVTNQFVRSILIGHNLYDDLDELCEQVAIRYHASSKKAIINCLKDARNRLVTGGGDNSKI